VRDARPARGARAGGPVDSEAAEAAARLSATPEFTDARGSRSHTDPSEVDETLERERTFILPPDQEQ
jgi:hypothetical protein